jgi:hypothetical protein
LKKLFGDTSDAPVLIIAGAGIMNFFGGKLVLDVFIKK